MKQTYFLAILFFSSLLSAQNVNIPDANFKSKLIALGVDTNNDGEIQNSEAAATTFLNIYNSDISNLEGIQHFINVLIISCGNNQLTSLSLSNLNNLSTIDLNNNQLTSLTLSNLPNLRDLNCSNNLLTILDVSSFPMLEGLKCGGNLLTTLDITNNPHMCLLECENNPVLTSIFMKNGPAVCGETHVLNNNPNLQYVCTDEHEVLPLINYFGTNGMNVNVNSYCSFIPGGIYNTIKGNILFDATNDGCDSNDLGLNNVKINLSNNSDNFSTFTDSQGNYKFYTLAGNFILTPTIENQPYFNFSPANTTIVFPLADDSVSFQNFCITANGIHPDLEIILNATTPARPGEDASYSIICRNKGNQTLPASIGLNFNDAILDFVSSSISPNNIAGSTLQWEIAPLMPFEQKQIIATFNINSPQETPAVNINDILAFSAYVFTPEDDTPADNTFTMNQTVTGSYDPNDITCVQGKFLPLSDIGSYLHYNIRFENTGTGAAANIVVKNTINLLQYDIQSLRMLDSSHPVSIKVTGDVAEFIFEGINLEPEIQGNVLYKIKTKSTLANNEVKNKAEIYFDYNFPIITNDELTVFSTLSNSDFSKDSSLQVYPNPAQDFLNVKSENLITSIQLYDSQGRLLNTKVANETSEVLDISKYSAGIYFVTVTTSVGKQTQKIIKK